jgi:8-oxo-dGTP diphosphatase
VPEPIFKYCPMCAAPLVEKHIFNIPRQTCPKCGFILFLGPKTVTVVVIEHEGKILLGRRNMNPARGMWSFFGGYVDRGEKLEDAAIREVKEETNLDVQLDALIGIYSQNGSPHVLIAYRASIVNNDISALAAQPEEMSELAFFSLGEIPELAFPFDNQILHDWKKSNVPNLPFKPFSIIRTE